MRIIVIGATGTIGRAVTAALTAHEVIPVTQPSTVDTLFTEVAPVDAVICCAASGRLTRLTEGSDEDFTTGVDTKLLGQTDHVGRPAAEVAGAYVTAVEGTMTGETLRA